MAYLPWKFLVYKFINTFIDGTLALLPTARPPTSPITGAISSLPYDITTLLSPSSSSLYRHCPLDLFAFIIKMPTMHRISCFRDDLVFLIYMYQRWIYRVDESRPIEK